MTEQEKKSLIAWQSIAITAAQEAGEEIITIYETGDFGVEAKADNSPLTLADQAAHKVIVKHLEQTEIPILSEEGTSVDFEERKQWGLFWMVDPLDGTKEFIKKNGEFTVNIALISEGKAIMGVVYVPVKKVMYYSLETKGAFKIENEGNPQKINTSKVNKESVRIVASRSHLNDETKAFIEEYQNAELVSMGSSLKLLLIAEGKADLYPRFAPTMEWDTAAAHAIVSEAGGEVIQQPSGDTVIYNKENLLNPWFLVRNKEN